MAAFPEVKKLLDDVTRERSASASSGGTALSEELPRPKRGEPWDQKEDDVVEAIEAGMEHKDLEVATSEAEEATSEAEEATSEAEEATSEAEEATTEGRIKTKPGKSLEVHLHHVYRKTVHDGGRAHVWGLKYCPEGKVILDRDRNAARNMLLCYLHRVRLARRGKTPRRRYHFTKAGNGALTEAAEGKPNAEYDIGEPRPLVSPADAP